MEENLENLEVDALKELLESDSCLLNPLHLDFDYRHKIIVIKTA